MSRNINSIIKSVIDAMGYQLSCLATGDNNSKLNPRRHRASAFYLNFTIFYRLYLSQISLGIKHTELKSNASLVTTLQFFFFSNELITALEFCSSARSYILSIKILI